MMTAPAPEAAWYTRAELQKIDSGTVLKITPNIGDNNDITLEMSIEVSDSIPSGRNSDLPVVTRRSTKNTVRIKDGGTVAVAGLTENRIRLERTKSPGLSEIPLLGGLFRNTTSEKSSREIAVFVTARLIPESEVLTESAKPPTDQTPSKPAGKDEFKTSLKESLSRPSK
jgi:type II secretory pathway component GspD/PulD (secretin)